MATRPEVYAVINGERTYHASLNNADEQHSIGDYLVVLDTYLRKAKDNFTYGENESVLHQLRKLAAVAVACMEEHGALKRVMPEEVQEPDPIPW